MDNDKLNRLWLRATNMRVPDAAAQQELFSAVCNRVLGFFRLRAPAGAADDLMQEVCVRVWRSRASFKPQSNLWAWICTIAVNVLRDELHRRRHRAPEKLPDEGLADCGAEDPAAVSERDERDAHLHHCIEGLDEVERAVVMLHHFDELTFTEIAHKLGRKGESLKSLCDRARDKLRACMEKRRSRNS